MSYSITRRPYILNLREAILCAWLLVVTVGVEVHEDETSGLTNSNPTEEVSDGSCLLQQLKSTNAAQQNDVAKMQTLVDGPSHHLHAAHTQYEAKTHAVRKYTGTPPPDVSPVWKVAETEYLPYVPHDKKGHFEPYAAPELSSEQKDRFGPPESETEAPNKQPSKVNPQEVGNFAYSSPRSTRVAGRLQDETGDIAEHHENEHQHHSIFMMASRQLDCVAFWVILAGMMAFTILIDRCENTLTRWCKNDKTEWMLLQRINAELMMFGVIGLGVFIGSNLISDIPEHYFQLFEFIDILCSLGAVGVIVIAAILWILRRIMERRWAVLERNTDYVPRNGEGRISVDQATMRQFEWNLMSRKFRRHQQLPSSFSYLRYLKECLAQNICDLMDLSLWSWMLLFILSLCGLCARSGHSKPWSTQEYEIAFLILVWGTFFLFVLVQMEVNSARAHLRTELGIKDQTHEHLEKTLSMLQQGSNISDTSTIGAPEHPKAKSWAWKIQQTIQFLSLSTAFEAAFYLMNVRFNLTVMHYGWWWKVLMAIPMFLNFFCMLPMIISRFTMVEAYFTPDHDAIDSVVNSMRSRYEDLRFLHHLWLYKGKPLFASPSGKDVKEAEFGDILRQTGIQVSQERLRRLFSHFDKNSWGIIDLTQVNDTLSSMKNDEQNMAVN